MSLTLQQFALPRVPIGCDDTKAASSFSFFSCLFDDAISSWTIYRRIIGWQTNYKLETISEEAVMVQSRCYLARVWTLNHSNIRTAGVPAGIWTEHLSDTNQGRKLNGNWHGC